MAFCNTCYYDQRLGKAGCTCYLGYITGIRPLEIKTGGGCKKIGPIELQELFDKNEKTNEDIASLNEAAKNPASGCMRFTKIKSVSLEKKIPLFDVHFCTCSTDFCDAATENVITSKPNLEILRTISYKERIALF